MNNNSEKMWIADQGDGTYINPILYTDYSDPDAIRVGDDFFMIASSFCNTPAIPVLHSKDLISWKLIGYALDKIPFPDYDVPAHGRGVWAPAIRYHDKIFYIFYPMPDEGIFMVQTKDPLKGWSEPVCVRSVVGWIDPCPFWDDDGKAYMVSAFARSRIGFKSILHMSPLEPDATGVLSDGCHIFDGNKTQPTIEGPKLYKRNGYYYIFAPAGGVKAGWQTVLRSKKIYGPYEEKIVLHQGSSLVNGPHQGAWVDTKDGEDWFLHFQDVGNAGRIIYLQPMKWVDDWPVIGCKKEEAGCGEPVLRYQKPSVGKSYPISAPEESDLFNQKELGLQWQWNANYKKEWYAIDSSGLILYSQYCAEAQLCDVPNLLLQKWPAPEFTITTKLNYTKLAEGDIAGMISLGGHYTSIAVRLLGGKKQLIMINGTWEQADEMIDELTWIEENIIYLKMEVADARMVSYFYSLDGVIYSHAGEAHETSPGRWVGVKAGLFIKNECCRSSGQLSAEYFVFNKLHKMEE